MCVCMCVCVCVHVLLTWFLYHIHHGHSDWSVSCPPAKFLPDGSKLSAVRTPRGITKEKMIKYVWSNQYFQPLSLSTLEGYSSTNTLNILWKFITHTESTYSGNLSQRPAKMAYGHIQSKKTHDQPNEKLSHLLFTITCNCTFLLQFTKLKVYQFSCATFSCKYFHSRRLEALLHLSHFNTPWCTANSIIWKLFNVHWLLLY